MGSTPQVVVHRVHLVAALREIHGRGPPEVSVATQGPDPHARSLSSYPLVRVVVAWRFALIETNDDRAVRIVYRGPRGRPIVRNALMPNKQHERSPLRRNTSLRWALACAVLAVGVA